MAFLIFKMTHTQIERSFLRATYIDCDLIVEQNVRSQAIFDCTLNDGCVRECVCVCACEHIRNN